MSTAGSSVPPDSVRDVSTSLTGRAETVTTPGPIPVPRQTLPPTSPDWLSQTSTEGWSTEFSTASTLEARRRPLLRHRLGDVRLILLSLNFIFYFAVSVFSITVIYSFSLSEPPTSPRAPWIWTQSPPMLASWMSPPWTQHSRKSHLRIRRPWTPSSCIAP